MNINLCGACGWLGGDAELGCSNVNTEIKPELKSIIDKNGLTARSCPLCKSSFIFSKTPPAFVIGQPGISSWSNGQPCGPCQENGFPAPYIDRAIPWIPNSYSRMPLPDNGVAQPTVAETILPPEAITKTSISPELDDDLHIESDLVADILAEASGEEREGLAQSLADGENRTTKEMIAQEAGVAVETLKDKPKRTKKKSLKRPNNTNLNRTCDDCGGKFYAKTKTNRCQKCNQVFMSKFVS